MIIQPAQPHLGLPTWIENNLELLQTRLLESGALLFRGFGVNTLDRFQSSVLSLKPQLMQYTEGATPRTQLKENFYTSTEYPPEHSIALHNELSYVKGWPMRLWFCCVQASDWRGETPLADVRRIYRRLPQEVVAPFAAKGWMLVRNYGNGLSLPWQRVFHTESREEVEAYCMKAEVEVEWMAGDRLRTRQVRPAIHKHPTTHETVWFNHVAFWHVSSLEPATRETFLRQLDEADLPYNTYYGDGSRIEPETVELLREAYTAETRMFPWRTGDFLMIDNMLVAHGRSPFRGQRSILAAMGDAHTPNSHQSK